MQLKPNTQYFLHDLGTHLDLYVQNDQNERRLETRNLKPETDINIPQDTELTYYISWDQQSVDRKLTLHLDKPGAMAQIIGYLVARQDYQFTLNSTIAHHAPHTKGNCLVKGVLYDQSQVSLSGMIQINHQAPGSEDQLTERLLVLSPNAIGQLQPELEILTDDVVASHATTISKPDPDQLFYLQSRGVNQQETLDLLVDGFLAEIRTILPRV